MRGRGAFLLAGVLVMAGWYTGGGVQAGPALITMPDAFKPASASADPPVIVPSPRSAAFPEGTLDARGLQLVIVGDHPLLKQAAAVVEGEVLARLGVQEVTPAQAADALSSNASAAPPLLIIGTVAHDEVRRRAQTAGVLVEQSEGYGLVVDGDGVLIAGADPQGAYWGVQTLRQLVSGRGLRFARIKDWPAFRFRGAMIYLDSHSPEVNDRLVELLAAYKFNHILVMANYVQWDATREAWHPMGASKEEARRVVELARLHGLEPIPLIELLGHSQWLFYGGANRDLLHDPTCPEPFNYDPLNPRVYDVVTAVLDEAIEVFRPRYVHIGHDEVRNVCPFPATEEARAIGFNKIFVDDVMRLYEHLRSRGVGTMMWQDVAFSEATRDVVSQLPKDIIFTDWHYQPGDDFPSIREIRDAGFSVIGATWYRPGNVEGFARSAWRDGALGMLQTRWTGYFGNRTILDGSAEQGVAYLRAAASFWNPEAPLPEPEAARRYYEGWAVGAARAISGYLVDISPWATRSLQDADGKGWIGRGPDYDLAALLDQATITDHGPVVRVGPFAFHVGGAIVPRVPRGFARDLPAAVTVPVGARAAAVAFLHATIWSAPAPRQEVSRYTLVYQDGTTFTRQLFYGREIAAWTEPTLQSLARYPAWRGQTRGTLDVALDVLVVPNPHPDRPIASIIVEGGNRWTGPVVVGLTLLDAVPPLPPIPGGR